MSNQKSRESLGCSKHYLAGQCDYGPGFRHAAKREAEEPKKVARRKGKMYGSVKELFEANRRGEQ